ncbi:hypothetical protein [Streptomyces achromogenes]|uniref:hypothetical protein n=1 Tax=Streptomyces achromogenes TaxID=67255 RepID=UPI00372167C2
MAVAIDGAATLSDVGAIEITATCWIGAISPTDATHTLGDPDATPADAPATRVLNRPVPMHASRAQADRALRIMHALLTEAEHCGHQMETRTSHRRGKAVQEMVVVIRVIRGHALPLAITERTTKVPREPTAEETSRQRCLSRAPVPKYNHEFSGRLELGAPAGSGYRTWYACGNSTRWPLEARLGHLLHSLEGCAVSGRRSSSAAGSPRSAGHVSSKSSGIGRRCLLNR